MSKLILCCPVVFACSAGPYDCGAAPSIGYRVDPLGSRPPYADFLWVRGQVWFEVTPECRWTAWYGRDHYIEGVFSSAASFVRTGVLAEGELDDLVRTLRVDEWSGWTDADLPTYAAQDGDRSSFTVNDHTFGCSGCDLWAGELDAAADLHVEEVFRVSGTAVSAPLRVGTAVELADHAPIPSEWVVPWEASIMPNEMRVDLGDARGVIPSGDDLAWFETVRADFLGRDLSRPWQTQATAIATYEGSTYYIVFRDDVP